MPKKKQAFSLEYRDISWLSFNGRVLQEAADSSNPLLERLHFLAIYSSNLDEFFRVRVASLRSLLTLKRKTTDKLGFDLVRLLQSIHQIVTEQQERFGDILRNELIPGLRDEGISLVSPRDLDDEGNLFVQRVFEEHIGEHLQPAALSDVGKNVFVKNRTVYLITEIWVSDSEEPAHRIIELPSPPLGRFVEIPSSRRGERRVMFIDDVIRCNIRNVYPKQDVGATYAVKLSRDADLHLDDEFSGDLVEMIKKSLKKRDVGAPCRFLYDAQMPFSLAAQLKEQLSLENPDMVQGGRYHNLHDFFGFPRFGRPRLSFDSLPPHPHPNLENSASILEAVAARDHLLHFPYQSYAPVIRFFEEAARDDAVEEIWASLYRVAPDSAIAKALILAQEQGKRVHVFVEVKARFDEETNLHWAEQMEQAGVNVIYSLPGLKVHAKIAMVVRKEGGRSRRYCFLGTGNFNEKTARIYTDEALLTADERLTGEIDKVFRFLREGKKPSSFKHLLVAPFKMRKAFNQLIAREIKTAKAGGKGWMILKMNSLEDEKMIHRLYEASNAGVDIRIIVRGICRLVPGVEGQSENIRVTSIVDRFLEHGRVYMFGNGGRPVTYLASADWMERNLNRRIEVAFPIYDAALKKEVRKMIDIQLKDNTKARIVDGRQRNAYMQRGRRKAVRAQYALYDFFSHTAPRAL